MLNEYFLAKVKQEPISAIKVAGIGRISVEQKIEED